MSKEAIKVFSNVSIGQNLEKRDINIILKSLYDTNFFKDIQLNLKDKTLTIKVTELPVIQNLIFEGIKSSKIIDLIKSQSLIKEKSSFNKNLIKNEKEIINNTLKNLGYYSSDVEIYVEQLQNNIVNVTFDIDLGKKQKLKK